MTEPVEPENKPENETIFCITGSLKIEDQKVPVVARTGDDTLIELTRPAKLGNALSIGTWLNDAWSTKVDVLLVKTPDPGTDKVGSQKGVTEEQVKAKLGSVPEAMRDTVAKLLLAEVWITDLFIRSWKEGEGKKKAFKFGINVDFTVDGATDGIELLPNIKLLDVGFIVSNKPKNYEFPTHKLLPAAEPVNPGELEEIAASAA
jgi:hypothetical protein